MFRQKIQEGYYSIQTPMGIWTKMVLLEVMKSDQIQDLFPRHCCQEFLVYWMWFLNKRKKATKTDRILA